MMTKTYIFIIGLLFAANGALAQGIEFDKDNFKDDKDGLKEAKNNLKEGDGLYEQGPQYFKEALPFYEKANVIFICNSYTTMHLYRFITY